MEIFNALLTPTIAIIAVYIAWRQFKVDYLKFKSDIYDRRLGVYEEVWKFTSKIVREANVSIEEIQKFYAATVQADFLFGEEVRSYIDEIHRRALNLHRQRMLDYSDANKDNAEISKEVLWFHEQAGRKDKLKFANYLNINNKSQFQAFYFEQLTFWLSMVGRNRRRRIPPDGED